jgi:hypothetical protein
MTEINIQDEGPAEETPVNPLRDMAQAFSSPSKAPTGTFEAQLSAEENKALDEFVEWLRTSDPKGQKTENTSNSYKSYVAQALVHFKAGGTREQLSTDVRSGVNAFARFLADTQA